MVPLQQAHVPLTFCYTIKNTRIWVLMPTPCRVSHPGEVARIRARNTLDSSPFDCGDGWHSRCAFKIVQWLTVRDRIRAP